MKVRWYVHLLDPDGWHSIVPGERVVLDDRSVTVHQDEHYWTSYYIEHVERISKGPDHEQHTRRAA